MQRVWRRGETEIKHLDRSDALQTRKEAEASFQFPVARRFTSAQFHPGVRFKLSWFRRTCGSERFRNAKGFVEQVLLTSHAQL